MALINERERAGDNTETVFSLAVSDTNEHDLPDVDGDDSAGGDAFSAEGHGAVAVKVHNPQDQDASVRLEGTNYEDAAFGKGDTVVDGVTVSAGGGTETLVADRGAPFDWYRVVVSFGTAPTGAEEIEAAYIVERDEER